MKAFAQACFQFLTVGCSLWAQPPLRFELKDARFGVNTRPFKNVEKSSCLLEASAFLQECPADYDCRKTTGFRVGTSGKGLGVSDIRRFYVVPLREPDAMSCWSADMDYQPTHSYPVVGTAPFVIQRGTQVESGEIPVYVEGQAPALVLSENCKAWTMGLGTGTTCKLTVSWQHSEHGGNLIGCSWADATRTLEKVEGCTSQADTAGMERLTRELRPARDSWRNLSKGKTAEVELQSSVGWTKWREAFQDPMEPQTRAVSVTAYYRLSAGGPVHTQEFAIPFQIASPWYLLLACLFVGSAVGSALPLAAAFAQRRPVQIRAWARTAFALSTYGVAVWGILYVMQGRVGLMQTELRLNQAIPVLLFGLFIGFRGLGFVIDWIERILTPSGSKAPAILICLAGAASVASAASAPGTVVKQLLTVGGQVLSVNSAGIFALSPGGPGKPMIAFADGATVGAAAVGQIIAGGANRQELIFVSVSLAGRRIVIDEYQPDGSQRENRIVELSQPPYSFPTVPTAMAWDVVAQRLYVASVTGMVWSIGRGAPPQRLATSTARISSLAVDSTGRRLFATDARKGRVLMLNLRSPASGFGAFADDALLSDPGALIFHQPSSRLFVADEHKAAVFFLPVPPPPAKPLATGWSRFVGTEYTYLKNRGFSDPVALAILGSDLWIGDKQTRLAFPVDLTTRGQKAPLALP